MSAYVKAWVMVTLLTGSFLLVLIGWLMLEWKGGDYFKVMFAGGVGFLGFGFLSLIYPKCPNCGTAVNMPETSGGGGGIGFSPERPKKECGYCGQDLT